MSRYRPRRIDRDAAERLLDGKPMPADLASPLVAQLFAASAPAHPGELAGERVALNAFHAAAQLGPVPRQRRQSMLKIALAKLLTVKAAAVVAAAGAGGIALAAGTGVLPTQVSQTPASPPVVNEVPATPSGLPASATDHSDSAGGNPSPSMAGLCTAYAAQPAENRGKALESPAFQALLAAAGSAEQVDGYCERAAASAEHGGAPSGVPAQPDARDNAEKGASHAQTPTSRPTPPAGPPAAVPTGAPTAPTAPPTADR